MESKCWVNEGEQYRSLMNSLPSQFSFGTFLDFLVRGKEEKNKQTTTKNRKCQGHPQQMRGRHNSLSLAECNYLLRLRKK